MGKLSKFFCVAVAGATCDGREIEESWINEMAETYNPATYTANVNIEHLRGISPNPPFNCQGKVVAVEKRTIELEIGGKKEKRAALYAQVDANDNLVAYNADGQKLFPSIEVNPSFAESKKAYLVGLATTDSPASLGTEVMSFAAGQGDKNFLNPRKQAAGNFFSAALPELGFKLEFQEEAPAGDKDGGFAAFMSQLKTTLAAFTSGGAAATPPAPAAPPAKVEPVGDVAALAAAFTTGFEGLGAQLTKFSDKISADVAALRTDHDALKASVEGTPDGAPKRQPATGGDGSKPKFAKIDC